ncbi:MAG: multicopper oxidase family protein [Candidatus Rokubacteria bacterium]|nr:multicopper oxidase family protein [Candidatus Rokubacteria bacterium]
MTRSRRDFLFALAGLGAGAVGVGAHLIGRRELASAGEGAVRTIHLEAREVPWELAPGRIIKAMAYNGQVPGPEIRAREGERLRVVLKNALSEPTTVHWHGVDVPNAMDGVPGITQPPVQPGETFVYEFDARPAGTRWYHTHFQEHHQLDLGLAAPLVIEPAGPEPMTYDREVTLVLDDWVTGAAPPLPATREGVAGGRGSMGGMMGGGGMGGRGMGGMMGGMMRGGRMMGGGHERTYDTMTINGKAWPATAPLRVRKGERVRLRLINASAEHTHVVRLAGHRLHVTHTDGNPLVAPVEVDALPIAPSERYDVVVVGERPGAWFLQCLAPGHAEAGERLAMFYDGHEAKPPEPAADRLGDLDLWQYDRGRGRDVLPPVRGATRSFDLTLSGGMMGSDVWTINRKVYPNTDPLPLRRGDRARVRFANMSMEAHPMHLHGQSFRVLAVNGARRAAPLIKDSVDVDAHMGAVVLEFTAHNPGDWFLHCHKPIHMEGGMIALVKIGA